MDSVVLPAGIAAAFDWQPTADPASTREHATDASLES
jgi:hypothetical protein